MHGKDPQTIISELIKQNSSNKLEEKHFLERYISESSAKLEEAYQDHRKVYEIILELQAKIKEMTNVSSLNPSELNLSQITTCIQNVFSFFSKSASPQSLPIPETKIVFEAIFYIFTGLPKSWKTIEKDAQKLNFKQLLENYSIENIDSKIVDNLKKNYLSCENWKKCLQNPKLENDFLEIMNWIIEQVNTFAAKSIKTTIFNHLEVLKSNLDSTFHKSHLYKHEICFYQSILNFAKFRLHQIDIELLYEVKKFPAEKLPSVDQSETVFLNYSRDLSESMDDRIFPSLSHSKTSKFSGKRGITNTEFGLRKASMNSSGFGGSFIKNVSIFNSAQDEYQLIESPLILSNNQKNGNKNKSGEKLFDFMNSVDDQSPIVHFEKNNFSNVPPKKSDESFLDLDRILKTSEETPKSNNKLKVIPTFEEKYKFPDKSFNSNYKPSKIEIIIPENDYFDVFYMENNITPIQKVKENNFDMNTVRSNRSKSMNFLKDSAQILQFPKKEIDQNYNILELSNEQLVYSENSQDLTLINANSANSGHKNISKNLKKEKNSPGSLKSIRSKNQNSQTLTQNQAKFKENKQKYQQVMNQSNNSEQKTSFNFLPTVQTFENEFSINDDYSHYLSVLDKANKLIIENQTRLSLSFAREEDVRNSNSIFMNGSFKHNKQSSLTQNILVSEEEQSHKTDQLDDKTKLNFDLQPENTQHNDKKQSFKTSISSPEFPRSEIIADTIDLNEKSRRDHKNMDPILSTSLEKDMQDKQTLKHFQKEPQIDSKSQHQTIDVSNKLNFTLAQKKFGFKSIEWQNAVPQNIDFTKKNKCSFQEASKNSDNENRDFPSQRCNFPNHDFSRVRARTYGEYHVHNREIDQYSTQVTPKHSSEFFENKNMTNDESLKTLKGFAIENFKVLTKKKVINGRELYCIRQENNEEIYVYQEDLQLYGYHPIVFQ